MAWPVSSGLFLWITKQVAEKSLSDAKLKLFPSVNSSIFEFKNIIIKILPHALFYSHGESPLLYALFLTFPVYITVMNLFLYGFFSCVFKTKNVYFNGKRLSDVFSF